MPSYSRTRTRDEVLVDVVRETPVDRSILRTRRVLLLVAVVAVALLVALTLWDRGDAATQGWAPDTERRAAERMVTVSLPAPGPAHPHLHGGGLGG